MVIYICDDAPEERLKLETFMKKYAKETSLSFDYASFASGDRLLETYSKSKTQPELIFLDIYMYGKTGIDVAKELRTKGYKGGIIFTTSSMEHAMASYEVNALYYLQKPYTYADFGNAMKRCESIFKDSLKEFVIKVRGKEIKIPYKNIVYFETGNHSVILHTMKDHYSFVSSMSQVAKAFKGEACFKSCGRSYLINLEYVKTEEDGELIMANKAFVPVPVRERENMRSAISAYKGK